MITPGGNIYNMKSRLGWPALFYGAWEPSYKKVWHGGDYIYDILNLPGNYTGYTRDKQLFHIYNPDTNGYTSYEGLTALQNWVTGGVVTEQKSETYVSENGFNKTGFLQMAPGGSVGKMIFGIAGIAVLAFLAFKK